MMGAGAAKTGLSRMRLGGGEGDEELSFDEATGWNAAARLDRLAVGGVRKPLTVDIASIGHRYVVSLADWLI